jgi:predicted kinase|tara:strand:+ start:192 stop:722 length:531 start_codon:yes stop_codon:yes gene_type:complete
MITLIVPIGAPGSGKSTLKKYLNITLINFFHTERDEEFSILRKNNTLNKTRKILFNNLELFLENISSTNHKNPEINYFVYLDSSNAKRQCREIFYQKLKPSKIIEINFNLPTNLLEDRVRYREHYTFTSEPEKQKEMIHIIQGNIEFSNPIDNRITKIYITQPLTTHEIYQQIIKA